MGHAGAVFCNSLETARSKFEALKEAGVIMTDHPSKFGNLIKGMLKPGVSSNALVR
jgi:succinyl-CoA synthetase alpha subunit